MDRSCLFFALYFISSRSKNTLINIIIHRNRIIYITLIIILLHFCRLLFITVPHDPVNSSLYSCSDNGFMVLQPWSQCDSWFTSYEIIEIHVQISFGYVDVCRICSLAITVVSSSSSIPKTKNLWGRNIEQMFQMRDFEPYKLCIMLRKNSPIWQLTRLLLCSFERKQFLYFQQIRIWFNDW